jgi:hypothetical protein
MTCKDRQSVGPDLNLGPPKYAADGHLPSRWFRAQLIFFDLEDGSDMFLRNVG